MPKLISTVEWKEIKGSDYEKPDSEREVLVYDGYIDDVVKGCQDLDIYDNLVWIEIMSGEKLVDPKFWAEVPFPGE